MKIVQLSLKKAIKLFLLSISWTIISQSYAQIDHITDIESSKISQKDQIAIPSTNNSPSLLALQKAAISQNPELKARYASIDSAKSNIDIAKRAWYPNMSMTIGKTYGRGEDSFNNTNVASSNVNETGKIGFNITQNLYDPTTKLNIEQAKLSYTSSEYALSQIYDELTNRTVSLFLDILASQAQIDLLKGQQIAVDAQKMQAQRSFDVGTVSITDVREAEAKADKIHSQHAALEWQLKAKQQELAILTGGLTINPADYHLSTKILPDIKDKDIEQWQMAITDQNMAVQQALVEYQLAKLDTKKQGYQYYPKVQFVIENSRNFEPITDAGHKTYSNNKWEWSAGIQLNINFHNTNTNSAQTRKIRAEENLKYQNYLAAKEQQTVELNRTFYQILALIAEYQGLYAADQSARTALSANQLGYQVGMRTNIDVLEAQTKVYEVNRDQLVAWYDSWKNYIKLNQIAGTLTPEQLMQIDNLLRQAVSNDTNTDIDKSSMPPAMTTIELVAPKSKHKNL